jgi:curved DNA-binding protein CbpA
MKDYYRILGVKETASEEEIRECWVGWMRKVHPDHVGAQRADERRVREINEAYEVLKYSDSRARYDLGRVYERKTKIISIRRAVLRRSYLLLLPILVGVVFLSVHETRLPSVPNRLSGINQTNQMNQMNQTNQTNQTNLMPGVRSVKAPESIPPEEEKFRLKGWKVLQKSPLFIATGEASPQGKKKKSPGKKVGETPPSSSLQVLPGATRDDSKEPGGGVLPPVEERRESTALVREKNGGSGGRQSGGNDPRPESPVFARPEEVEKFFEDYLRCYTEKDIQSFLCFFSAGAVQNRKENIDEIRKIYTRFFDQSESLLYHLKHPEIEIVPGNAQVKASYEIKQTLKTGDIRLWKGNIEWALIRENGELKISSIRYEHDRSP